MDQNAKDKLDQIRADIFKSFNISVDPDDPLVVFLLHLSLTTQDATEQAKQNMENFSDHAMRTISQGLTDEFEQKAQTFTAAAKALEVSKQKLVSEIALRATDETFKRFEAYAKEQTSHAIARIEDRIKTAMSEYQPQPQPQTNETEPQEAISTQLIILLALALLPLIAGILVVFFG